MAEYQGRKLQGRFWLTNNGEYFAGHGRIELLRNIGKTGSISAAAKLMGMSYKAAWDSVNSMNKLTDEELITRVSGGKHGGGSTLTEAGVNFINTYDKYMEMFNNLLNFMELNPELGNMIDKMNFRSSAENIFFGKITGIEKGAVSSLVRIETEGICLTASVSLESVQKMEIKEDSNICALINANQFIIVDANSDALFSARNVFKVKVSSIKEGAVNSEVKAATESGKELSVLVTNESISSLNVKYGKEFYIMCKASDVILVS